MSRNRAALLAWSSTPQHARQRFVLRGYRRRPFSMSVTFFTLHNETANIWTHVMAFGWALIRIHDTAQDSAVAGDARASMRGRISSCGRKCRARTMGPATSCGKKKTKVAKSKRLSVGFSFFR